MGHIPDLLATYTHEQTVLYRNGAVNKYLEKNISIGTINCKELDLIKYTSKKVQVLLKWVLLKGNFSIILFNKCLLRGYYVLGTVLGGI